MRRSRKGALLGAAGLLVALTPLTARAIQGGSDVPNISSVPYVGRLTAHHHIFMDLDPLNRCGATLISLTWALSASHCLDYTVPPGVHRHFDAKDLTLTFSSVRADGQGGERVTVTRIVRGAEDLALLELKAPASTQPVRLVDRQLPHGYPVSPYGWAGGTGSAALKRADMSVAFFNPVPTWWHEGAMGLSVPQPDAAGSGGVQHGDSGGPVLVQVQTGGYALVGVNRQFASKVEDYKKPGYSEIWSRTDTASSNIQWIRNTVGTVQSAAVAVPYGPYPPPPAVTPGDSVPTPHVNASPIASFTYSRKAGPGNLVTLNGRRSSDRDGTVIAWQWRNGSTIIASGLTPTVAFGARTSAAVTLRVTDDWGASAETTKTLSLPNRLPVIRSVTPNGSVVGTTQPQLAANASDPDADSLQYSFHVTGPSVDVNSGWTDSTWTVPAHRLDPGTRYGWSVTARDTAGATATSAGSFTVAMLPTAADVVATPSGAGYWQVASDGGVFSYGDAQFYGSLPGLGIHVSNVTGMVRTPDGAGYWLSGSDGGVYSFGDAQFYGSLPGLDIHVGNIVGMAATKTGNGYWLVGSDGGVFAFGDAGFHGSMGGQHLNQPVVAIAPTASGEGYWLAAADGGIFSFGDAQFYGSMGGQPLNAPVVDMDATPDGGGYWMTAEDGGVFAFGNAGFHGSMAGQPLNGHITGMSVTPTARGYWLNGCDGGVFAFGDAVFRGSNPTYQCRGT